MIQWAEAIEASAIGTWIRQSTWAFALGEVVHLFGLALVLGTAVVLNLRLLGGGLRAGSPPTLAADLRPWTALGLLLSTASGVVLGISEPVKLVESPPFLVKMGLFALAAAYSATLYRRAIRSTDAGRPGARARVCAAISLALWFGVAIAGRLIAFY